MASRRSLPRRGNVMDPNERASQVFHRAFRPNRPEERVIRCYQIKFVPLDPKISFEGVICWPGDAESPKHCVQIIEGSGRSWWTLRAGDRLLLRQSDGRTWKPRMIEEISLYRCHPDRYVGTVITTAEEWLNGVPAIQITSLPSPIEGIPMDRRGYVPTAETEPFDLDWDHGENFTHYFDGGLTEYGEQWQRDWPAIVDRADILTNSHEREHL